VSVLDRIAAFAHRPAAGYALGVWAAAEAVVLPIVPDVGLCLLVLAAPRRAARLFAAVLAGALLGTIVLAALTVALPEAVRSMLLSIPGIDSAVLAEARETVTRDGVAGFAQFGPGTPLKVYSEAWVGIGGDLPGLLLGAILNRLTRIGPGLLVAAAVGWFAGPWLRRHERATLAGYSGLWLLVYGLYLA
jgi:hypothetical protein